MIETTADGVDAADAEELLALLSPEQRDEFLAVIRDPTRASVMLAAEEAELVRPPWWTVDAFDASAPPRPALLDVATLPPVPDVAAVRLLFNVAAVLCARRCLNAR